MTRTIQLANGRALAFAEHGPADGLPVLFFHGSPASHPNWSFFGSDELLHELGLRILAVDRPGIGRSGLQLDRSIADWPHDVVELLNALELSRAGILSHSLGGAYALACAVHVPERLAAVALVAPGPRHFDPPFRDGMVASAYAFLELAARRPRMARLALRTMGAVTRLAPGLMIRQAGSSLPPADADLLTSEGNRRAFVAMMHETLRAGPRGAQLDAALAYGPWELPLEEISVPVAIWHGEQDRNVPVLVARDYHQRIPGATLHVFPEDGHLSIMSRRGRQILEDLRERMSAADAHVVPPAPGSERPRVRP